MTCIAAVVEDGKVWIGGDAAGVDGQYNLTVRRDPKVFTNGPFLIGFTTSFRMGDLLRYSLTPPDRAEGDSDDYRFLVTKFVESVRSCLKAGGFAEKHHDAESGGSFLVGYRGRLYALDPDYQVGSPADDYDAVGCGAAYAKGVLYATRGRPPEERVRTALEAAERHSAGVRGPFTILNA